MADSIENLLQAFVKAKLNTDDLTNSVSKLGDSISGMMSSYTNYANEYINSMKNMTASTTDFSNQAIRSFETLNRVYSTFSKIDPFAGLEKSGGRAITSITDQTKRLLEVSEMAGQLIPDKLKNAFADLHLDIGTKAFSGFIDSANRMREAQQFVLGMASATGKLTDILGKSGPQLEGLNDLIGVYGDKITVAAEANNMADSAVRDFLSSASNIPGVFEDSTLQIGKNGEHLDRLTSILRISAGAQISNADTTKILQTAYEKLGNAQGEVTDSIEKGEQIISLMSESSNKFGVRLSDMEDFLSNTAETFKDVGDNTESATRILNNYVGALRQTGLTTKESVSITNDLVSGLNRLSTGTKAVVSARSGGPGGLQGMFRIEQMLREGKADEVLAMTQRTLRQQFGGRIYTQAEAASSPEAAAQFYRQRALLQSGVLGPKIEDPEKATRLLEAMKSGIGGEDIISGQDAVKNTAERGNEILLKQANYLQHIDNVLTQQAREGDKKNLQLFEKIAGSGGIESRGAMIDAQSRYAGQTAMISREINKRSSDRKDLSLSMLEANIKTLSDGSKITASAFKEISSAAQSFAKIIQEGSSIINKATQETRDKVSLKEGQERTAASQKITLDIKIQDGLAVNVSTAKGASRAVGTGGVTSNTYEVEFQK